MEHNEGLSLTVHLGNDSRETFEAGCGWSERLDYCPLEGEARFRRLRRLDVSQLTGSAFEFGKLLCNAAVVKVCWGHSVS